MKYRNILQLLLLATLLVVGADCLNAQPGGGPGGRPPGGGPGGRPPGGRRPPSGDWNRMGDDQNAQQVKKKKKVREGDTFKVVGSLRDSVSGEFLPFVNVAILDSVDSTMVKAGATNLDGLFEIADVPTGGMLLRISAIGYQSRYIPFHVSNNTALGTIRLVPGATSLNAVTITAERPIYAMDGEKMIYNVSDDPSIQTGTTEDALQNAPGVEVDVEGNITLRGVSSVEIWINDKPSKLTEENLKTYLQTLPANALARIETITNPSAKYATTAEAVINIVTSAHIKSNQFVSFGINGSSQPFVSPWVSYMWAKERLSINLFASGRYSYRKNESSFRGLSRKAGTAGRDYDSISLEEYTDTSNNKTVSANIFMNVNYEIDSTQEISFDGGGFYNYGLSREKRIDTLHYYTDNTGQRFQMGDTSTSGAYFGHIGADYTKKFDDQGHNLRLGINTRANHNSSREYYDRAYTSYRDPLNPIDDEHRALLTNSTSFGASLDARYNRPYSLDGEMSYGLRLNYNNSSNEYSRYNDHDETLVDPIRTYNHDNSSLDATADVNWTHRWGGFTLEVGLGSGWEHIDYNYQSPTPSLSDDSTLNFLNVNPSLHLSYRTNSMHNFKLNYSLRMSNPSASQLTTFRTYGDDSYSIGNPDLKASYTHSAEAGWQKFFESFGNIGLEGYARFSNNEISSLRERIDLSDPSDVDQYLAERIISFSKPYNMGSSWRYGTTLNMTYRPTGFFNVRLYANLYNYGYRMDYQGRTEQDDMWSWSARVNAWAKVYNQYQLTASFSYTSRTLSLMSERKDRISFNIGARTDFFKRKLSVFVNIQDLFNWGASRGSGSTNTNPYYLTDATQKMVNSRYISAGITLRFGKLELENSAKDGSSEAGDSL